MITVFGGIKGGSGKTTLATNLVELHSRKKKVLLVDADEQKSASDWVEQRVSQNIKTDWTSVQLCGKTMYAQLSKFRNDYDDIIVDVGGRDTTSQRAALAVADRFIIPFKPRSFDVWTIGPLKVLIEEMKAVNPKLVCYAIINQGDAKGIDNEEAKKILANYSIFECLDVVIGNRKSFGNAAAEGKSIFEIQNLDKKAQNEFIKFYKKIYN